jgi:hypothetical protein
VLPLLVLKSHAALGGRGGEHPEFGVVSGSVQRVGLPLGSTVRNVEAKLEVVLSGKTENVNLDGSFS